ncbi:MAG: hypothetical protein M1268_02335 [Patescibacteria group bacterium]|nr:hypothetical protein [Patescibacteria group bacterium]
MPALLPTFLTTFFDAVSDTSHKISTAINEHVADIKRPEFNPRTSKKDNLIIAIIIGAIVVIVLLVGVFFLGTKFAGKTKYVDTRVQAPQTKASQTINKELLFPIKNSKGDEVTKIKYLVEGVDLQDAIIIKGQKANAVKGRTFLIVNLKITNDYKQAIEINSKDYVRLSVNGNSEMLAADIHNDPVQIQAISTKLTRLGFPIDDNYKTLTLQVGEINGKKETIKLSLKKI